MGAAGCSGIGAASRGSSGTAIASLDMAIDSLSVAAMSFSAA